MAVQRQLNVLGQMRFDAPHLRSIESGVAYDFDTLAGVIMSGRQPYIVSGFTPNYTVGALPTTVSINVAGATVMNYGASEPGTILRVPDDRIAEVLNSSNSRVIGSFSSGVNYVSLDYIRAEDDSTADVVQFLDPSTNLESPKIVPLSKTLDYRIYITTFTFNNTPNLAPLFTVTVTGGVVTAVSDYRPLYYRLAAPGTTGSSSPYPWAQGRGIGITAANESALFTGGDKAISNEHDWKRAIMSMIWQINGGEYWYSPTTMNNTWFLAAYNQFTWASPNLSWSGTLYITFTGSTATYNQIAAGSVSLADGECAYVNLDRATNGATLTVQHDSIQNAAQTYNGNLYVIAWRIGTTVYVRNIPVAVGGTIVGTATTTLQGTVKIYSTDPDPKAIIANPSGLAIAEGLYTSTANLNIYTGASGGTISVGVNSGAPSTVSIGAATGITNIQTGATNGNFVYIGNGAGTGQISIGAANKDVFVTGNKGWITSASSTTDMEIRSVANTSLGIYAQGTGELKLYNSVVSSSAKIPLPKFAGSFTIASAGAVTINGGYNVTSATWATTNLTINVTSTVTGTYFLQSWNTSGAAIARVYCNSTLPVSMGSPVFVKVDTTGAGTNWVVGDIISIVMY